jgi:hypothetical protein
MGIILPGSDMRFNAQFQSQSQVESDGATLTAVTFSAAGASFNGSTSKIVYARVFAGIKSVRLRAYLNSTTSDLLKLSSTHSITCAAGVVSATGFSSPTIYVDGAATTAITTGWHDIVVTTATDITCNDIQLGYVSTYFSGVISELQLFFVVLTAGAVANYANSRQFLGIAGLNPTAWFDFVGQQSSRDISSHGYETTDTLITYAQNRGADFGTTSRILFTSPLLQADLTGLTVVFNAFTRSTGSASLLLFPGDILGRLSTLFSAKNLWRLSITYYTTPPTSVTFRADVTISGKFGIPSLLTFRFDGTKSTNATKISMYVDMQQQSPSFTLNAPSSLGVTTQPAYIGGIVSNCLNGSMGGCAMWNRALTDAEIAQAHQYFRTRYFL